MDSIFELLPLVLIILWTVIGAGGAKKKAEQQRAEAAKRAREAQQRARLESRESEGRITVHDVSEPTPAPSRPETDSSVDMVPDELWKILTGGAPPPTRPRPTPRPTEAPTPEVEPGGWATSPPWDEDDAVNSIEGVSAEEITDEIVDYDDEASATARARYETPRSFTWEDRNPETKRAAAIETDEIRHVEFHDNLRASEIGGALSVAAPRARERLGITSIDEVRRAIVLMEVLGPPKALQ